MKREHVRYLVCTACHGPLSWREVSDAAGDRVRSGVLTCARCLADVPVVNFIPRFVPDSGYADGFGVQWTLHARTQLDSYTGSDISERRFFEETRWPRRLDGETILEIGCGAGRFTPHAAGTGAMVVSVDLSSAVDVNYASHGHLDNVLIVQADIYNLPLTRAAFDKVFCFGVLQHTPDVERAFRCVTSFVRDGGRLAIDVYRRHDGWRRLVETKRWVRPLSRRLPARALYRVCRAYIAVMWPITGWLHKVPRVGRAITQRLLIADYRGDLPLPASLLKQWAVLDTFDMLSPRYDAPQTIPAVHRWYEQTGFERIEVSRGYNGIEARGVKMVSAS